MKTLLLLCCAFLALCVGSLPSAVAGTCSGDANCTACSTCKYCQHCAKEGGSCGVKERLIAQRAPAVSAADAPPTATPSSATLPTPVPNLLAVPAPAPSATPADLPAAAPGSASPAAPAVQTTDSFSVCLTAIAAQSDPAKLATLGSRGTNPRLKRILYYLAHARTGGADPGEVIDQAQRQNGSFGTPRAPLVKASLLRNLKICDGLGLLTPDNLGLLRRGNAPVVMRGPYQGEKAEVDHIVPRALCWEADNELANLEMLPTSLNRGKGAKVGERQLALAAKLHDARLISDAALATVQDRFKPAGTASYELAEP